MGLCKVGLLLACMLLMDVLSNVYGQPVQISSSDTDCPVDHLETQLARMDDRLNRMQEIISSMNKPPIKDTVCCVDHLETRLVNLDHRLNRTQTIISSMNNALIKDTDRRMDHLTSKLVNLEDRLNRTQTIISSMNSPLIKVGCTVDLAASGYDDTTTKYGYIRTSGGSSEQIYLGEKYDRNRGVTLVELDAKTCTAKNRQRFDTHSSANDRKQLLEVMESASAGTIVVGVSSDTPENEDNVSFKNSVGSFFSRYNMNLTGPLFRDKFAFVMQKGYLRKTLFERKARLGDSLRMRVALRGSTIYDVTFNRV